MLPQVATHILHHTSRAAAAVHNQTSQAIRNAWQFQQTTPSASSTGGGGVAAWGGVGSSSGWGGSSTGAGGAKYHAGSRFYSGYTGPGRTITQANQTSAQPDDNDDRTIHPVRIQPTPAASRPRPRSSSLSLSTQGRIDRGEGLGVLQVVQMRARHAFATQPLPVDATTIELQQTTEAHERPVLVRRNSTSTHSVASSDIDLETPPTPSPAASHAPAPSPSGIDVDSVDPVYDLDKEEPEDVNKADFEAYNRLYAVAATRDYDAALSEVQRYRATVCVSVPCYNMALHALISCRSLGQPITLLLEIYNEMLGRSLLPNTRTYRLLIMACCTRDIECQRVISTLENRISRRSFHIGSEKAVNDDDEQCVAQLRAEYNFASAIMLLEACSSAEDVYFGINVYNSLLRSCAYHGNASAAIKILAHMERFPDKKVSASTFAHMIHLFGKIQDVQGAREVFNEFKEASKSGRINWLWVDKSTDQESSDQLASNSPHGRQKLARRAQVLVWNKMIVAYFKCGEPDQALGLLEAMLDTPPGELFTETDAPLPNSVTYTSIITSFCESGEWQNALSWFERLLVQKNAATNPFEPLLEPPRPDGTAWIAMLDSLARVGAVNDLNRIFTRFTEIVDEDKIHIRMVDRFSVFRANVLAIRAPGVDPSRSQQLLDFLVEKVILFDKPDGTIALTTASAREMLLETVELLMQHNKAELALDIAEKYVANYKDTVREAERAQFISPPEVFSYNRMLRNMVQQVTRTIFPNNGDLSQPQRTDKFALRVAALHEQASLNPQAQLATSTRGNGVNPEESIPDVRNKAIQDIRIDLYHSRFVDEWYPVSTTVSILDAFERFTSGAKSGVYPSPETLGRLIAGLGRLGNVEKVRVLYDAAQVVLAALEDHKRWQSAGWFVVEDQMIIAFAHAGEYEAANVHRRRIIEQGGSPSADAYGALIASVKDTTDDTTNALELWDEAMTREVRANTYLYNTIISKLSKARKADHAMVIFRKMQSERVKPSSITFGAMISACCRVGDAQSAENLFHEMTTAFNFKPRVPPYNTMIQFYTHTKPDRERVLYYYNALLAARIKPTAHTYKLLLEAYGTIQPVDLTSMDDIFLRITDSRDVEVNGAHWGALINAYGCAANDLDRAMSVFESIPGHSSTARSSIPLPDAIVYEALFAVFSHHRRTDLIRTYLQRLRESEVHPTAYVANAALKGYAAAGDLDTAREIFEDLEDPPMGVAAPHNHVPHEHQNKGEHVPPHAPVFREPSTWEAMVRAELGVGERERAVELIKRMEARKYPQAVVQRVRDIMYSDGFSENTTPSLSTPSPTSIS